MHAGTTASASRGRGRMFSNVHEIPLSTGDGTNAATTSRNRDFFTVSLSAWGQLIICECALALSVALMDPVHALKSALSLGVCCTVIPVLLSSHLAALLWTAVFDASVWSPQNLAESAVSYRTAQTTAIILNGVGAVPPSPGCWFAASTAPVSGAIQSAVCLLHAGSAVLSGGVECIRAGSVCSGAILLAAWGSLLTMAVSLFAAIATPTRLGAALAVLLAFRTVLIAAWLRDASDIVARRSRWDAALARETVAAAKPPSPSLAPVDTDWKGVATASLQRGALADKCCLCLSPLAAAGATPRPQAPSSGRHSQQIPTAPVADFVSSASGDAASTADGMLLPFGAPASANAVGAMRSATLSSPHWLGRVFGASSLAASAHAAARAGAGYNSDESRTREASPTHRPPFRPSAALGCEVLPPTADTSRESSPSRTASSPRVRAAPPRTTAISSATRRVRSESFALLGCGHVLHSHCADRLAESANPQRSRAAHPTAMNSPHDPWDPVGSARARHELLSSAYYMALAGHVPPRVLEAVQNPVGASAAALLSGPGYAAQPTAVPAEGSVVKCPLCRLPAGLAALEVRGIDRLPREGR